MWARASPLVPAPSPNPARAGTLAPSPPPNPSTSGDVSRLHRHQIPARAGTLAPTLESAFHGEGDHGFRDQLFFCIFFRENFGLANDQHLARAQHPAAAAQAVGHGRTQEINLE